METFLVVQWIGICLPVRGTQVQSLVGRFHMPCSHQAREPQLLKPVCQEPVLTNKKILPQTEAHALQLESSPHSSQLEEAHT